MSFREHWILSIAIFTMIALVACVPAAAPDQGEPPGDAIETPSGGTGSNTVTGGDPNSFPAGLPAAEFEADEVLASILRPV